MLTELGQLLTDPAHLAFEVITDAGAFLVGAIWHALWVRRHDAKRHPLAAQDGHTATDVRYTDLGAPAPRKAVLHALGGKPVPSFLTGALVCNEEHPCERCIEEGRG